MEKQVNKDPCIICYIKPWSLFKPQAEPYSLIASLRHGQAIVLVAAHKGYPVALFVEEAAGAVYPLVRNQVADNRNDDAWTVFIAFGNGHGVMLNDQRYRIAVKTQLAGLNFSRKIKMNAQPCIALQPTGMHGYDGASPVKIALLYQVHDAEHHFARINTVERNARLPVKILYKALMHPELWHNRRNDNHKKPASC